MADWTKDLSDKLGELGQLRRPSRDQILDALGLQEKADHVLPAMGIFGVGMVVGAALGMVFAPRSGKATRKEIERKVDKLGDKARDALGMES